MRSPASTEIANSVAEQSAVLLLNRNSFLPLRGPRFLPPSKLRILLVGPTAHSLAAQCGGWLYSFRGLSTPNPNLIFQRGITVLQALRSKVAELGLRLTHVDGISGFDRTNFSSLELAKREASSSDIVVICVGEPPHSEGTYPIMDLYVDLSTNWAYANSHFNLPPRVLPPAQVQLVRNLTQGVAYTKRPKFILIQFSGRPRLLHTFEADVDAIIHMYLPGLSGGEVAAGIVFGDINPAGRLPFPYPKENGPKRLELDSTAQIWHPFGFGLSFSNFSYSNLVLTGSEETDNGPLISVTVDVTNYGPLNGTETVFVRVGVETGPQCCMKELKRFHKLFNMVVGERRRVMFTLFAQDFRYVAPLPAFSVISIQSGPLIGLINLNSSLTAVDDSRIPDSVDNINGIEIPFSSHPHPVEPPSQQSTPIEGPFSRPSTPFAPAPNDLSPTAAEIPVWHPGVHQGSATIKSFSTYSVVLILFVVMINRV